MLPFVKENYFIRRRDTSEYLEQIENQVPRWTSDVEAALHFAGEDEFAVISPFICESLGDKLNTSNLVFVDEFFVENNEYTLIDSHPLNSY